MNASSPERQLILASGSPRRAQLLREAGFSFAQVPPPFDDTHANITGMTVEQATVQLATQKANSVLTTTQLPASAVVIGSDTLLSLDGRPIGKPRDLQEAQRTLRKLMDREHHVVTGVCVLNVGTKDASIFSDVATVHIGRIEPQELDRYLASGAWQGKAGGYNLAELADRWNIRVTGDPTTVVGLPIQRLLETLRHVAPDLPRS